MPTIKQLLQKPWSLRKNRKYVSILKLNPQLKGIFLKVYSMNPKKPNWAVRKVAKVKLSLDKIITSYIPDEGHTLQEHSVVLLRGGRLKDLPGVHYHLVRGNFDLSSVLTRFKARSKYGKSLQK